MTRIQTLESTLRSLGPYLLIELLLPGGTLIALLAYLFNHRRAGRRMDLRRLIWNAGRMRKMFGQPANVLAPLDRTIAAHASRGGQRGAAPRALTPCSASTKWAIHLCRGTAQARFLEISGMLEWLAARFTFDEGDFAEAFLFRVQDGPTANAAASCSPISSS